MRTDLGRPTCWLRVWVVVAGLVVLGCSAQSQDKHDAMKAGHLASGTSTAAASVNGKIQGTDVNLLNAEFDGELAIFEGDGWGWNPSLLIFLFLDEGEVPENSTFTVNSEAGLEMSNPHVHYRWRNPDSGEIEVDAKMQGYAMTLTFGELDRDMLPGTIEFSLPGGDTRVSGTFRAKVKR